MALSKRIIPLSGCKRRSRGKRCQLLGLRDAGNPVDVAKRHNDEGADELTFWTSLLPATIATLFCTLLRQSLPSFLFH